MFAHGDKTQGKMSQEQIYMFYVEHTHTHTYTPLKWSHNTFHLRIINALDYDIFHW